MSITYQETVNIKIISDGTCHKVTLEDGTLIKGVTAVKIDIQANGVATATLEVCLHSVEVRAGLDSINVKKLQY